MVVFIVTKVCVTTILISRFKKKKAWYRPWAKGGDGGSLSKVWCNNTDLGPGAEASVWRSGNEQILYLWHGGAKFRSSSYSRVRLLNMASVPVILEWLVEVLVLVGTVASGTDIGSWSFWLWSDALACPRRPLSLLVSRLMGLLENLVDCRGAVIGKKF